MDPGLLKRLLGAAVLIALAVIFVPMLLPGGPTGEQAGIKVPSEPDGALQTRVLKVGPDGASAGSSTAAAVHDPDHVALLDLDGRAAAQGDAVPATSAPAPVVATGASAANPPAPAPAEAAQPRQAVATAPAKVPAASAPEPAPVLGGAGAAADTSYSVNLGIYADHAGAHKLVAAAEKRGFKATATPESFQGKQVLRVRVGPYPTRAAAEAARLKLQAFEPVASMTVDAQAANQTADAPSSAIPAGQPGGWAVQLGAFSAQGQANMLRDRLRNQGFDGYVDDVGTDKGKLWRVRAGPFASRDAASAARERIADKLKIKGMIVTQH